MNKTTYQNTTINILLQQESEVTSDNCPKGIISLDDNGEFRFEEEIRKGRPARNPKLFDGDHISMVRMQNGKYQFHLKTFNAGPGLDGKQFAAAVKKEIEKAFKIINS